MGLSKILIIGVTGHLGRSMAYASIKLSHPTFALVRRPTLSDPAKSELLKSLQNAGVTLLVGDLSDHASLVAALKQVDVVISSVSGDQIEDQLNILDAAKEAGTIKRFIPSEFGMEVDRLDLEFPAGREFFEPKKRVRRAAEKSGIPFTFVASSCLMSYFVANFSQNLVVGVPPPRDGKLVLFGDGNTKAVYNDGFDVATFTIKAADDPRAANKILVVRPKENVASLKEVIAMWETKIAHTFEKQYLDKEGIVNSIETLGFPSGAFLAIRYFVFVKGDCNFELDPSKDVDATALYPGVKYTTIDEYLNRFV